MALLQKKAAARGKEDGDVIGPAAYTSVPAATGIEARGNGPWQLKIACLNVDIVPTAGKRKKSGEEMKDVMTQRRRKY